MALFCHVTVLTHTYNIILTTYILIIIHFDGSFEKKNLKTGVELDVTSDAK